MLEQEPVALSNLLKFLETKIPGYRDLNIGEQGTKISLINPVLQSLGWNVSDPDEVQPEYKVKPKGKPVDYALKIAPRDPKLFIEAKGLGEDLSDWKWINQVIAYAAVAGVEWCVLTDGDEYRIYNVSAPVVAEEKLLCKVRISDGKVENTVFWLSLLSRSNIEGNLLVSLWAAHFVDGQVKAALDKMVASMDKSLIRLLHKKTVKLTPKEIIDSIKRLNIHIDPPATPRPTVIPSPGPTHGKNYYGVDLIDVIKTGLLVPPVKLCREYKKQMMEATLLADGVVEFQGKRYSSCSAAGGAAMSVATGHKMHNPDGWSFWQTRDDSGKLHELTEARVCYLAKRPRG